jgi:ABC-type sugar transport system permease subunit
MPLLSASAWIGGHVLRGDRQLSEESRESFGVVLAASLTLLGLIIGFTFSMAVSRYDQRKNYEEAEANAIGTEYLRLDLLPSDSAAAARTLLRAYTSRRIAFYTAQSASALAQVDQDTTRLQRQLWTTVETAALSQPDALRGLVIAGMNDVLNSQGFTQAAWWNRIPSAAWAFMVLIAMLCNAMVGYSGGRGRSRRATLLILPLIVAISLLLIADIDSPRSGIIHVAPQNLMSLTASFDVFVH